MDDQSPRFAQLRFSGARSGAGGLWGPVLGLAGLLATGVAVTIGAILAVFTAVAVAVIAVVGGLVMMLAGFVMRTRRSVRQRRPAAADGVIEAHKVGDTWVPYGWERQGR